MAKQMKVDVEKSLGYQENGRVKKEDVEIANLPVKRFLCPNCHHEEQSSTKQFGESKTCPACGSVMTHQG